MAQIPALISFNPNTTILSADTNSNNSSIRTVYNAHDTATTAVHGMGASTIVGTALSQNLTNKTITAAVLSGSFTGTYTLAGMPTITAPTISAPIFTGNITLTGSRFVSNVNIYAGDFNVYSDAGITKKFSVDGSNGSFGIPSGSKFYPDGTALNGDTYISEVSSNVLRIVVGGVSATDISATLFSVNSGLDLAIGSTKKLYLDSGGDTYIFESSANIASIVAGGDSYNFTTTKLIIPSGNFLEFGGAGAIVFDTGTSTTIDYATTAINIRSGGGGTISATFNNSGTVAMPNHGTTASAANMFIDSVTGIISRSTSSIKYKRNVSNLELDSSLIYSLRPVSYDDKKNKNRYFGLIAEEVNAILPDLVDHRSDNGECEGVYYDRLSVLLLAEMAKLKNELSELRGK